MNVPRAVRHLIALGALGALGLLAAVAVAQITGHPGRVGPSQRLLANGRRIIAPGRLVELGNFPTGGALTPDGRFYWTVSTGRGFNDVRIVSVATRKVIQVLPLPGASGGIVMDPVRSRVYVSGVADSDPGHADQRRPGLPGAGGDVVHVFAYGRSGRAAEATPIPVPPPGSAPTPQNFPPTNTKKVSWPDRLAVSPDGKRLLVPLNLADAAAIVDVASKGVRYVPTGTYPYGAAILRDGKTGLVSNEAPGTVSVIDLDAGTKVRDIQVGPHLSHPEAIAVDPRADRAYVAVANSDQVAVIDTKAFTVARTLSVERPEGQGTSPVALTTSPDGSLLLVAESAADEIAVFKLPQRGAALRSAAGTRRARAVLSRAAGPARVAPAPADYSLIGRIPTADYPADVAVSPVGAALCAQPARLRRAKRPVRHCSKLLWVAGKSVGVGPNPNGPDPYKISDKNAQSFQYLPNIVTGSAGVLDMPSVAGIRKLTPAASRQLRPINGQKPPAGTPLRPGGPIKHVFYIVRENRTYDQVLGDEPRGDGDPKLSIFGRQVTPNIHALVQRFPLVDHVYANSEASIDGHFWTSAAQVSDYVHKNWNQNYAGRNRPYDFGVYSITWPQNRFLFDQASRQGISYFNFGEAIAGTVPLTDKDRTADENAQVAGKFAKSDLGPPAGAACYPNDAYIGKNAITMNQVYDSTPPKGAPPTSESRFDCFQRKFNQMVATDSVPAFTYAVLSNDHTLGGGAGQRSPRAMVAENDYGLGQMVDLISHSKVWKDSAIFVIEDDSQDGADHVDAHRIPAAVFSPYARRGAVIHTRYDFLSVIRSMELILGMKPLGLFDNLATPMYDAFSSTPSNPDAYDVISPTWPLTETNPKGSAAARMSRGLNFKELDRVPQRQLDAILWKTVHGDRAVPPPPGPNAQPGE